MSPIEAAVMMEWWNLHKEGIRRVAQYQRIRCPQEGLPNDDMTQTIAAATLSPIADLIAEAEEGILLLVFTERILPQHVARASHLLRAASSARCFAKTPKARVVGMTIAPEAQRIAELLGVEWEVIHEQ